MRFIRGVTEQTERILAEYSEVSASSLERTRIGRTWEGCALGKKAVYRIHIGFYFIRNKKLLVTSATLVVTSALLVVTRSY